MARLSRRNVVAALGSAPLLADGAAAKVAETDPVLLLCAHYGDLVRRQEWLMRRWGDHEAWLADDRNWFVLSKADQKAVPEAGLLQAIDDEYDRCVREGAGIVRRLRSIPAMSLVGAAAKLSVVAEVIDPEDYPAAHRLLLAVISDLHAIRSNG